MTSASADRWQKMIGAWWAPALAIGTLFVAGIAIYGLLHVGPRQQYDRDLFLLSLTTLVAALVCALRGLALRQDAIAGLREAGARQLDEAARLRRAIGEQEHPLRAARRAGPLKRRREDEQWTAQEYAEAENEWYAAMRQASEGAASAAETLDRMGAHREATELGQRARTTEGDEPRADVAKARADEALGRGRRLARRARTWLAVAAATGTTAFGTAVATTATEEVARAVHVGQPLAVQVENARGAGGEGETCTQAIEQVVALGRADPALAKRYANHLKGLPPLVGPEVQERCGGDYTELLPQR